MRLALAATLCAIVMGGVMPYAAAQTPPGDMPTLWVITNRGNVFELEPPDLVPTTDIVSSPYIEFQRHGGLVASGGEVYEAGQYTDVSSGNTYVISNWAEGRTYGIPHGAPLVGEMHMYPIPHLWMRTPNPISSADNGIRGVDIISGSVAYNNRTHMTHGEYFEFSGSGRAIVWLEAGPYFAIHMVCPGCVDNTHAVIGYIEDDGVGNPKSTALGTAPPKVSSTPSIPCTVDSVSHPGCGVTYTGYTNSSWPMDPRSTIPIGEKPPESGTFRIKPVLHVTNYDTVNCPTANSTNTRMEPLNDTMFRMVSDSGCVMENYRYEWWDGVVNVIDSLPLRAGINTWESTQPHYPAIILNLDGGDIIRLQVRHDNNLGAYTAFWHGLNVHHGPMVDADSLVILHDAYAHLGAYTQANLHHMADEIRTLPQLAVNSSTIPVAHNPGGGKVGGILGHPCIPDTPFQYCIVECSKIQYFQILFVPIMCPKSGI